MKTNIKYFITFFIVLLAGAEMQAQYGYGYGGGGYGYGGYGGMNGRGRGLGRGYGSAIPQRITDMLIELDKKRSTISENH